MAITRSLSVFALALAIMGVSVVAQAGGGFAAQQPTVEITPHIFALVGAGSEEATIIGSGVLLRTRAGQPAVVDLVNPDRTDGTRLVVIPTDLGSGRIILRVEFTVVRSAGRNATANFEVLSGPQTQRATVALRDAQGGFMRDQLGRPIYATFDAVTKRP